MAIFTKPSSKGEVGYGGGPIKPSPSGAATHKGTVISDQRNGFYQRLEVWSLETYPPSYILRPGLLTKKFMPFAIESSRFDIFPRNSKSSRAKQTSNLIYCSRAHTAVYCTNGHVGILNEMLRHIWLSKLRQSPAIRCW